MRRQFLSATATIVILASASLFAGADPDRPRRAKSTIYNQPAGSGPATWQWGKQLFWDYADTSGLYVARREADKLGLSGVAPVMNAIGWLGAVRWGDTTLDTSIAFQWRDPAWKAYTRWTYAHDSLTPVNPDGTYRAAFDNPKNSYWIPFTIPLDSVDCPKGMSRCTYGDFAADRIGRLAVQANLAGLYAADFVDGLPGGILTQYSFHPRILKAFEDSTGIDLPDGPVSEQSAAIYKYHMSEWIDFWGDGWGRFYADVAKHVRKAGRLTPLVCAQTAWDLPRRRMMAVDFRRYIRYMPSENWFFAVEMQGDNLRPMKPHGTQVGLFGTYTAWEPEMPIGAKINVNDQFLNDAMRLAGMPANLETQAQMQRSQYLLTGFTHLATRSGKVRRAAQAFEYGYYDNQSQVDPRVTDFLLAHFPRRPYGPGFFYSKAQLKTYEQTQKSMYLVEQADSLWNVAPFGYFVTDASLDSLRPESRPTAWIVPSLDRLPAAERAKLEALAPILKADSAAKTSPVRASRRGRAWGFWDHESSLVVLVSNPDSLPLTTTLTVAGLKAGAWEISYLGLSDSLRTSVITGTLTQQLTLPAYDTYGYLLRPKASTSLSGKARKQVPTAPRRLATEIDGVEFLGQPGGIRNALGRYRIPH
jgi:hypothetical protein